MTNKDKMVNIMSYLLKPEDYEDQCHYIQPEYISRVILAPDFIGIDMGGGGFQLKKDKKTIDLLKKYFDFIDDPKDKETNQ